MLAGTEMGIERLAEFWPEWSVDSVLGEGSYGKVYKIKKSGHGIDSVAALKVISVPSSDAELRALMSEGMTEDDSKKYLNGIVGDFVNEIKLMEDLKSAANIVTVEDYKVLEHKDGIGWDIFIRMELLTPFDLVMAKGTLEEDEILKLGIDLCSALEACEKHNVIHRDIKPANIFVSEYGDYKMGDFGVAKELEKTKGAMSSKGTYSYMAPEVSMGKRYDASVDIYSLGIVMFTLLNNNRLPFIDANASAITYDEKKLAIDRRMSGEELPAPLNASPELASIILTACKYDPSDRYTSPTELKNSLINYRSKRQYMKSMPAFLRKEKKKPVVTYTDATVAVRRNDISESSSSAKIDFYEEKKRPVLPKDEAEKEKYYLAAREKMVNAIDEKDYSEAAEMFTALGNYRDSKENIRLCSQRAVKLMKKHQDEAIDWNEADFRFYRNPKATRKQIFNIVLTVTVIVLVLVLIFSSGGDTPTM